MDLPKPSNELERLRSLASYGILDSGPEAAYDDIVHLASHICESPIAAVSLVDSERQWFKSISGFELDETPRELSFCAHAILTPDLLIVPDTTSDERFADNPFVTGYPGIRFYAGAPLVTPGGETLGTVCVIDQVERTLSEEQEASLRALSRQVMALLELRKLVEMQDQHRNALEEMQKRLIITNEELRVQSLTDDVTGYHNTRFLHGYLNDYLENARPEEDALSLVFFDMDNFKSVVDTHGHLLGAKVLREVAQVVEGELGSEDRIVRYGGDEFVLILPDRDREQGLALTEKVRRGIASTSFLLDEEIGLGATASFGMAVYPEDAISRKELLLAADQCLFESKSEGKNRVSVLVPC